MVNIKKKILIMEAGSEFQKRHLLEATQDLPYDFYLIQTGYFRGSNDWIMEFFSADKIIETESINKEIICEKVVEYALHNNINFDGITTFWEGFVPTTQYLQTKLKLPVICNGDIRCLRHKGMMRERVGQSMKQPQFRILHGHENAEDEIHINRYPLIVKPAEMAASLGVTKVHNDSEFLSAVGSARGVDLSSYYMSFRSSFEISDDVLIEEYIECDFEISVEGIVLQGALNIVAICHKLLQPEPVFWEYGEITPSPNVSHELSIKIHNELQSVVNALSLHNCAFHAEIRVRNNELYFIEMGARIGGYAIPEIVTYSSGVNLFSLAVPLSCGDIHNLPKTKVTKYAGDYSFNTNHSPQCISVKTLKDKREKLLSLDNVKIVNVRDEIEDTIFGDMVMVGSTAEDIFHCINMARGILAE